MTLLFCQPRNSLQRKLNNMRTYRQNWGLQLNSNKTEVVIMSPAQPKFLLNFKDTLRGQLSDTISALVVSRCQFAVTVQSIIHIETATSDFFRPPPPPTQSFILRLKGNSSV